MVELLALLRVAHSIDDMTGISEIAEMNRKRMQSVTKMQLQIKSQDDSIR